MGRYISILSCLLFLIGCATDRPLSSPKFVLEGFVTFGGKNVELANITFEIRRGVKWVNKKWSTKTDNRGRYKIVVSSHQFGRDCRVKASFYDAKRGFHVSEWKYTTVRFARDKKDFKF